MLDQIRRGSYLFFDDVEGAFEPSELIQPPPPPDTDAQIGSQARIYYWHTGMNQYVAIPNVRQFGPTGATKPETSSTDADSAGEERIGGLPDGDEFDIVCVANTITNALLKSFFTDGINLDLKVVYPAPLSLTDYIGFTPLHFEKGAVTPSALVETTLRGRISGSISDIDPHA